MAASSRVPDTLASALTSFKGMSPVAELTPELSPWGVALSLEPASPAPGARVEPLDDDTARNIFVKKNSAQGSYWTIVCCLSSFVI